MTGKNYDAHYKSDGSITSASLRDKFAIAALNGCLSHSDTSNVAFTSVKEATEYYAKLAYAYADAMLKARG
ncbi:hypothetical protein [Proteus mirabilis]|uniref:hypothetical protein n=1 Tax=Proteus mirabilis TaxID=584 RepID=UPI0034E3E409